MIWFDWFVFLLAMGTASSVFSLTIFMIIDKHRDNNTLISVGEMVYICFAVIMISVIISIVIFYWGIQF